MRFGLSTHLFHGERLARRHFEAAAGAGFSLLELFATRTHLDYHDPDHLEEVGGWIRDLGLSVWSVHAPICDSFIGGVWGRAYSNASSDARRRDEAVDETILAVEAARRLESSMLVLHLGVPRGQPIPDDDNNEAALRRSLEPIAAACTRAGVRLALEVIPNDLATPDALLTWLEADPSLSGAGVCLDVGHAHLVGGAPEAAEALGGHVLTTHLHDNAGRTDDHLLPFTGTIDWPATLMALVKVGYTGPLVFELPDHGDAARTLAQAVTAQRRIQEILERLTAPLPFSDSAEPPG
jgi:sugar phosphate isomerase/epimerase